MDQLPATGKLKASESSNKTAGTVPKKHNRPLPGSNTRYKQTSDVSLRAAASGSDGRVQDERVKQQTAATNNPKHNRPSPGSNTLETNTSDTSLHTAAALSNGRAQDKGVKSNQSQQQSISKTTHPNSPWLKNAAHIHAHMGPPPPRVDPISVSN